MRQQLLHGYLLHQRRYRENSKLVHFFSLEFGRIDGVTRQSAPPLYQPVLLYATGKSSLKSLSKIEWVGQPKQLMGAALLAGFYVNELLVRLLPLEENNAAIFAAYGELLQALTQLPSVDEGNMALMRALRHFEGIVLQELGYGVQFGHDVLGQPIIAEQYYRYDPREGFSKSTSGELGKYVIQMAAHAVATDAVPLVSTEVLYMLTRVYRRLIGMLIGNKPLKSRELWVSNYTKARH